MNTFCPNDILMMPIVGSREGCQAARPEQTAPACPETGYPVVVVQTSVPQHGGSALVTVHPHAGYTPNMWVSIPTALNGTPFTGQITSMTAGGVLSIRNAMADGSPVVTNPSPGTLIRACSSVAIVTEPSNYAALPSERCHPSIPLIDDTEVAGFYVLTRGSESSTSTNCDRRTWDVGATKDTFYVRHLPMATPSVSPADTHRLVVWNQTTFRFQGVNGTGAGFVRVSPTGGIHVSGSLDGALISAAPTTGAPAGYAPVMYDPASKGLMYVPPAPQLAVSGALSAPSTGVGVYPEVSLLVPVGRRYEVHTEARMSTDGSSLNYVGIQVDGVRPTDNRWIPGEEQHSDTIPGSTTAYHSFVLEGRATPYAIRAVVYSDYQLTTLRMPWNNGASATFRNFIRATWYAI